MRILIASAELAPFAKVGGLGDTVKDLALALRDEGCDVELVIPGYLQVLEDKKDIFPIFNGNIEIGGDSLELRIFRSDFSGIPLYLINNPEMFSRKGIYGDEEGEYKDNAERFIFFCHSIPVLLNTLGRSPDVLLANDWHTGLLMPFIKEGKIKNTSGVFVIHNMIHGLVHPEKIHIIGLPESYYGTDGLEFYGNMSLLKAGIVYSDAIITVSPTYAKEIQEPEFGAGLDGLMRSVSHKIHGILNGADYETWNPEKDRYIKANYSLDNIEGKRLCKQDLINEMNLADYTKDMPIIGMVTRLVEQKGCTLVIEGAREIFDMGALMVVLGKGEPILENLFLELKNAYHDLFALKIGFDEALAHKIIAGADMLLMPSLYEPCGLTQMYAMRYGTIPIVRATGGLNDTVTDPKEGKGIGTGFKFHEKSAYDMIKAIDRAIKTYHDKGLWEAMMKEAMKQEFSWRESAKKYMDVFKDLRSP